MGYVRNHLATLATGAFALTLTGLWAYFMDFAPLTNLIFQMAVPITWFMTFICWIAQKSTDYTHNHATSEKQLE